AELPFLLRRSLPGVPASDLLEFYAGMVGETRFWERPWICSNAPDSDQSRMVPAHRPKGVPNLFSGSDLRRRRSVLGAAGPTFCLRNANGCRQAATFDRRDKETEHRQLD